MEPSLDLVGLVQEFEANSQAKVVKVEGHEYVTGTVYNPPNPNEPSREKLATTIKVGSLTSVVEYLNSGKAKSPEIVVIQSHISVQVYGPEFGFHRQRDFLLSSDTPDSLWANDVRPGQYGEIEAFYLWMQSNFILDDEALNLLHLIGNVRQESVKSVKSDPMCTLIAITDGTGLQESAKMKHVWELTPRRSFPEIDPVPQSFVVRVKGGGPEALPQVMIKPANDLKAISEIRSRIKQFLLDYIDADVAGTIVVLS